MLFVSSLALADLAEDHAKNCLRSDVKNLMGPNGSCRILITPKKIQKSGSCSGVFQKNLPCVATFNSESKDSALNLKCGTDLANPILDQDMEAEFAGYNLTTIVKTSEGKDVVVEDRNQYSIVTNKMILIQLSQSDTADKARFTMDLENGQIDLEDVTCN